jgi:multicomponent K+:H+ antiporter subunit E
MKKLIPHPLLSAELFLLWLALGNSVSAGWALLGLLLAVMLPLITRRFWISPPHTVRLMPALLLLMIVLYDIVVASLQVARLVLGPVSRIRPAFVSVPLDLRDPYVATLLGSMVSLTPGTVAVDVDQETWIMQVHALDVADEAVLVQTIKTRYEARLREIFSC